MSQEDKKLRTYDENLIILYSLPDFFDKYYKIKENETTGISCMSRVGRWKMCINLKGNESDAVVMCETKAKRKPCQGSGG